MTPAADFISGQGISFYIPAYQRYFAWGKKEIDRFFEGIIEDIGQRLVPEEGLPDTDTVSFIGTVLCYENVTFNDIYPQVRNQVPQGVHSIIDGQQRITMLIVLSIILHDYIRTCDHGPDDGWLHEKCLEQMVELVNMFRTEKAHGEVKIYPKMIRAFDDQWSINEKDKKYHSPVSYYIFHYANFLEQNQGENKVQFNYDEGESIASLLSGQQKDAHKNFGSAVALIKKWVRGICAENKNALPDLQRIFRNPNPNALNDPNLMLNLFNTMELPDSAVDFQSSKQCQTARAILLAIYIMKKVYFVSLVTKDENYAFDIFDSLNTTGELLTAYETFRPTVIQDHGLSMFRDSDSKKHLDVTAGYLEKKPLKQKVNRTADMLVTFALAESGVTLSKKLHVQRKYMKESYDKCSDKPLFTQHLMHVSNVWRLWSDSSPNILKGLDFDAEIIGSQKVSEANFCLRFLKDAGHTITLALIARFYATVKIQHALQDEKYIETAAELCDTIKVLAAFFAVWRSSRETADGIDTRHRKLMKEKFNRMTHEGNVLSHGLVQQMCCQFLKEGGNTQTIIDSQEAWVDQSKYIPIYRTEKAVAKFLLFLGAHNTRPDPDNPCSMKRVRDGIYKSLIAADTWGAEDYRTIEHICPQSSYTAQITSEHLNRIGNLTLLPLPINSHLGNGDWKKKRAVYRMLSAESDAELNAAQGVSIEAIEKYRKCRYLPMTKTVAEYDNFYVLNKDKKVVDVKYIEDRGINILDNAWEILAQWLDFNED